MRKTFLVCFCCLWGWVGIARADDLDKGKELYSIRCAFCHGAEGRGDGPAGAALQPPPTNFVKADYWKSTDISRVKEVIKNGKPGTAMVPYGASLSSNEIEDVAQYLKTLATK